MRHRRVPIARRTPIQRSQKPIPRTKRPAKHRKTSLGAAKRTLWDYFASYVKARDGNCCISCGAFATGGSLHAGHLFSRQHGATLYDPKNCHSQCAGCNRGRRGNTPAYADAFIERYGAAEFIALARRSRGVKHWTLPEVLELTAALKRSGADFELLYAERFVL